MGGEQPCSGDYPQLNRKDFQLIYTGMPTVEKVKGSGQDQWFLLEANTFHCFSVQL